VLNVPEQENPMQKTTLALSMLAASLASGCAMLRPPPIQAARVQALRRVAIVGLTLEDRTSDEMNPEKKTSGLVGLVNVARTVQEVASGQLASRLRSELDGTLSTLTNEMHNRFGWEVAPIDAASRSPSYATRYQKRPTIGNEDSGLCPPGILSYDSAIDWLRSGVGATAAQEMEVDGVVAIKLEFVPGAQDTKLRVVHDGKETGVYQLRPKARISIELYDVHGGPPIWSRRSLEGDAAREGITTAAGIEDRGREAQAFVDASYRGWVALIRNYDQDTANQR
jgi:hypothetical protein